MARKFRLYACALVLGASILPEGALAIEGPFRENYSAKSIELENLVGVLRISVGGAGIQVDIRGKQEELDEISVSVTGEKLVIQSDNYRRRIRGALEDYAVFQLRVPAGTDLTIDEFIGEAKIGDLESVLKIDANAFDAVIGDVISANIDISGSGDIEIGDIKEELILEISGAGELNGQSAGSADIDISGSGDVSLGPVFGGLEATIAGSGDIEAQSVSGPVRVDVAGSGSILIRGGEANPLKVSILGSGDFKLLGNAVDPEISAFGSGRISLKSYSGKLTSKGQSNLTIGD